MIDHFGPHPLTTAISQRTWKFAAAFKHVRTERLRRFLAQIFENYLTFNLPEAGWRATRRIGEIGQNLGGCRSSRQATEVACLVFFSYFCWGR